MKPYRFNTRIKALEIFPGALAEGVTYAAKRGMTTIRILAGPFISPPGYGADLDFADLEQHSALEHLMLFDDFRLGKVSNLEVLYTLPGLRQLSCDQPLRIDLARLPQLEALKFKYYPSFSNLAAAVSLRVLWMWSYNRRQDLTELSALTRLQQLHLVSTSITSLHGIEPLAALDYLVVSYARHLTDIGAVAKLPVLKTLKIPNCANVDLVPLNSASLSELALSKIDNLAFLSRVPNLETLHFTELKDGNLAPVLDSRLRQVLFVPDKKHYTHKMAALNELLERRQAT